MIHDGTISVCQVHSRAARSLIMVGFYDSFSDNEYVSEVSHDEDYISAPSGQSDNSEAEWVQCEHRGHELDSGPLHAMCTVTRAWLCVFCMYCDG